MSEPKKHYTVALVGNPNAGKTTVFNALTGAKQVIGNWPGVTVERKEGELVLPDGTRVTVVDLPGIYSLMATSEDERVSVEYILAGGADLYLNVVDGSNLERNLYLTLLLSELGRPMATVLTMMDIVEARGIRIDLPHLSAHLGCPVLGINANATSGGLGKWFAGLRKDTTHRAPANPVGTPADLVDFLASALTSARAPTVRVAYPNEIEEEAAGLVLGCAGVAAGMKLDPRVVALRLLEGDPVACAAMDRDGTVSPEVVEVSRRRIGAVLREYPDEALADARYGTINGLVRDVVSKARSKEFFSTKIDRIILNRWLGIPFFLFVMYVVFWLTQIVGGAFIDFFDLLGGTVFVQGSRFLLGRLGAPAFLVALVSDGLGAALQTVGTFIPPIFFMFLCLSVLEDSGYMARAAFVMDRFMSWLGLPGKSFVPLLVGFGCSVPAIMATRTLDSRRDRFLTLFMIPFMSCGAKLPVWTVFAAAFFPENPGRMVFAMYAAGIVLGVATGWILRRTLFTGEPSHFIMELPPYHCPRPRHILLHSWDRLKMFVFRAGKVVVPMVLLLGMLNTVGTDGSFGNQDSRNSLLAAGGRAITPVFTPMGVGRDNWPATVAVFSGLFAKESVIGTMTSLYGQNSASAPVPDAPARVPFDFWGGVRAAFASVPRNLAGIVSAISAPPGNGEAPGDKETGEGAETSVFQNMREAFPEGRWQAFSYMLFILLYVPCLAAMGAAVHELGKGYGALLAAYLTVFGWCVATLHYQIRLGHSALWIAVPVFLLLAMFGSFRWMGRSGKVRLI